MSAFLEPYPAESLPRLTTVGVSFVGIFVVVYNVIFFVFGLSRSLAWDYAPGVPQGEEAERRVPWSEKPIGSIVYKHLLGKSSPEPVAISVSQEKVVEASETNTPTRVEGEKSIANQALPRPDSGSTVLPVHSRPPSVAQSLPNPRFKQFLQALSFISAPINLVIGVALCIALIQPLKALFVDVSAEGGPSWKGPDGKPPLGFFIDTGSPAPHHGRRNKLIPSLQPHSSARSLFHSALYSWVLLLRGSKSLVRSLAYR